MNEVEDDHHHLEEQKGKEEYIIDDPYGTEKIKPFPMLTSDRENLPQRSEVSVVDNLSNNTQKRSVQDHLGVSPSKYTLKDYNKQRMQYTGELKQRKLSSQLDHGSHIDTQGESKQGKEQNFEVEVSEDQASAFEQLNQDITVNRLGNIRVSLFWEEKVVIIIRFIQFYGYFMLSFYEVWPYQIRSIWARFFFFMCGSFHFMIGPVYQYAVFQSLTQTVINLGCYVFFLILVIGVSALVFKNQKVHFRLLKMQKRFLFFKWYGWFLELIFLPLLVNIIEFSLCPYYSEKDAVQVLELYQQNTVAQILMILSAIFAFGVGAYYIVALTVHLNREKVSNLLHEEYLKKKEIEYTVGISEMWNSRHFYLFSSFKSEFAKMHHRIIFNVFVFVLVVIHAVIPESAAKIGITAGLFTGFTLYIIATRPYRCQHSNILIFILSCIQVINTFLLLLKKGGLKSALFVDNYFYGLLTILNAFGWVIAFAFLLLIFAIKGKWPLNKDHVLKVIQGQDFAIIYIKKARLFRRKVIKTKIFGEKQKQQLDNLLKMLSDQFNNLRDRQPVIMDALLEVIEQLKEMKKNYEENPFLYNFNFQEELKSLVHTRYRIYEVKKI